MPASSASAARPPTRPRRCAQLAEQARAVGAEARSIQHATASASTSTPAMPLYTPSQLLPGLMVGASLRRPKRAAAEVGGDVGHPDQAEHRQHEVDADAARMAIASQAAHSADQAEQPAHGRGSCGHAAGPLRSASAPPTTQTSRRQPPDQRRRRAAASRRASAAAQASASTAPMASDDTRAAPVQARPTPSRQRRSAPASADAKGQGSVANSAGTSSASSTTAVMTRCREHRASGALGHQVFGRDAPEAPVALRVGLACAASISARRSRATGSSVKTNSE